jgi:hypothetical protein
MAARNRRVFVSAVRRDDLIIFNAYHDVVQFTLPGTTDGAFWCCSSIRISGREPEDSVELGDMYQVTGRSLLMLKHGRRAERMKLKAISSKPNHARSPNGETAGGPRRKRRSEASEPP